MDFRDKTVSHLHTDPKLIEQIGCTSTLSIGKPVYLDTDGVYKLAIANSERSSNVQGIVWSFVGGDSFYLKTEAGSLQYRFPLTKNYFNTLPNGRVDENSPNASLIPGVLGQKLFLSETVAGGFQLTQPTLYPVILGYKTEYGFVFRPELVICCVIDIDPISSSSSSSSSSQPESSSSSSSTPAQPYECTIAVYNICYYYFNCLTSVWTLSNSKTVSMFETVPAEITNVPLLGTVDITGTEKVYSYCDDISGALCIAENVPNSLELFSYDYETDHNHCIRTFVKPLAVYVSVKDLYFCGTNPSMICSCISGSCDPTVDLGPCDDCCSSSSSSVSSSSRSSSSSSVSSSSRSSSSSSRSSSSSSRSSSSSSEDGPP